MIPLAFVVTLLAGVLLWVLARRAEDRRVGRISGRSSLDAKEIWKEFYEGTTISPESVEAALRLVGDATNLPPGKLRPSDRFADELAPEPGWEFDDGLAQISWYLESLDGRGSEDLYTIDDLIRRLSASGSEAQA
jgi:hypothetical protein